MTAKETLGIFVTSDKYLDHIIGVAKAAKKAGKALNIFLTHNGVRATQDPKFQELADVAPEELSLCNLRWEEFGLKDNPLPPGMDAKDLATQSRHCAMIGNCYRYLVF